LGYQPAVALIDGLATVWQDAREWRYTGSVQGR
jgi:hypothetical protein